MTLTRVACRDEDRSLMALGVTVGEGEVGGALIAIVPHALEGRQPGGRPARPGPNSSPDTSGADRPYPGRPP